ncbi:hypothetical protein ANCDUO_16334 [Ancylostoma duodenale]|uniref:Uncharacterized protein n=1 Tax=Ancylostoma duodenale TaxID=51022 RepID=A0A0C2CUN3_9BILA|nr:hypothetical protein ANCDUO_16334 [Ancylostoma duodenale]
MHLPARVWIPLSEGHIVLNIPPTNSCVLNSKDKESMLQNLLGTRCLLIVVHLNLFFVVRLELAIDFVSG